VTTNPHSRKIVKQCATCPWRVDCDPERDIPGYKRELHERVAVTIRNGHESLRPGRAMACHHSKRSAETYCAGWLHYQMGPGNNLGVRLDIWRGAVPAPVVDGEQHARLEDTFPKPHK
jgi:hypothetical protein